VAKALLTSRSDAILTTKLYVPRLRPNYVSRPRLTKKLDEASKLTLISATAGFGKTSLLSEWVTATDRAVAWLSLDEGDNDSVRFLTHFIAALETIRPEVGEEALALLEVAQSPPLEPILTSLLNDLARDTVPSTLVLDDYQVVTQASLHQALTFVLEHLPPQLSLMIASRIDPPLPLSRLRGQGRLAELRTDDLRFSQEEAGSFLNERMGLNLSADDIAALENRTEGWIVGLQLAALSLKEEDDPSAFIKAFAGDNRYVIDYLLDEVFSRQPQEVQSFLLKTAVLDRLHGPLCDAVLGHSGSSQDILEALEQANLFIVSLDSKRQWYRYHHLFADLLRYRLHLAHEEEVAELHRRATAWYEREGFVADALKHVLLSRAGRIEERRALRRC
jgi:LuxR family transcriptional regulator, maltose regulon positive regulatory protein